jgi:two-component system, NarL family, nitrate/nitrite response regulator NarL
MFRLDPYDPITAHAEPGPAPTAQTPTATATISVVVADDHPLYRQGIIRALEAYGDFLVIGDAGDGAAALWLIRRLEPDIALLDVRMPILDGVEVVNALALHGPDVPVVLLSAFSDGQLVTSGLEAGAAAYINKTEDRDAICLQLTTIAGSNGTLAPRHLGPRDPLAGGPQRWAPRLTGQEHELLQLAAKGLDKLELAQRLHVDETEIRHRACSLTRKLDADSLTDAVARGRSLRLIR